MIRTPIPDDVEIAARYYVCYARRRHGRKACDQDLIPEKIEDRLLGATICELEDGAIFREAADYARRQWEQNRSGGAVEKERLIRRIDNRRTAIDRYLKAFEKGHLPQDVCSYRVKEVSSEIATLEQELGLIESKDSEPTFRSESLLDLKCQIEAAIRVGTPQKVKKLLGGVVGSVVVHSRHYAEPSYFFPGGSRCVGLAEADAT